MNHLTWQITCWTYFLNFMSDDLSAGHIWESGPCHALAQQVKTTLFWSWVVKTLTIVIILAWYACFLSICNDIKLHELSWCCLCNSDDQRGDPKMGHRSLWFEIQNHCLARTPKQFKARKEAGEQQQQQQPQPQPQRQRQRQRSKKKNRTNSATTFDFLIPTQLSSRSTPPHLPSLDWSFGPRHTWDPHWFSTRNQLCSHTTMFSCMFDDV